MNEHPHTAIASRRAMVAAAATGSLLMGLLAPPAEAQSTIGPSASVPWTNQAAGFGNCISNGVLWGNLVTGVTKGSAGGNNTVRATTGSQLNAAILYAAQNGLLFYLPQGTYEIYNSGGVVIPPNYSGFRWFGAGEVDLVQYYVNAPIWTLGSQTNTSADFCYNYSIDGVYAYYGVSQTGNTAANAIVIGQTAYSNLRNIGNFSQFSAGSPANPPYYGVLFSAGGTSPTYLGVFFANTIANVKSQGAQQSLWKLNLNGEGNNYENLFLNAGSGVAVATASHAMDLSNYAYGANSNDTYTKVSIDFCKPASGNSVLFLSTCTGIVFNGLHIEEASQTGGAFIQLAGAQVVINGLNFLNTHSRATEGATTAGSFFYFYQNEGLSINGLTLHWDSGSYVDTNFAGIITKGGTDEQPKVFITGWDFVDAAGTVAAHIPQFDPSITSWPTVPDQFTRYEYGAITSKIWGAQWHLTGSATIYGQFIDSNVIYPATLTGTPVLTLADTVKATGGGSTQPPMSGNTVKVRRASGTFATNLLVNDGGGTTLTTNSAAASTYYYHFGTTVWSAFT